MKRIFQALILLIGVSLYSQNSLSVKDGAHGYDEDFVLEIDLETGDDIKALQFDLKFDQDNFNYLSNFTLNKERLGGDDSDHVIVVRKLNSGNLRMLIYSPSNKAVPTGNGKLLSLDFHNSKKYGNYTFELLNVVASKPDNTNLSLTLNNGTITTLASYLNWSPSNIINVGDVYKGQTQEAELRLDNLGTADLVLTLENSDLNKFALTDKSSNSTITWPQTIKPGEALNIIATFTADVNGTYSESITLKTNAPLPTENTKKFEFKGVTFNDNRLSLAAVTDAYNNKISEINVTINANEEITAFQFDVSQSELSTGKINLIDKSAVLLKSDTDHVVSSSLRTDSEGKKFLRIICYSPSNQVFANPVGEVVKFSVRPEGIVDPGQYTLNVKKVTLTSKGLTNVSNSPKDGNINLITGRLAFKSPVNSDLDKRIFSLNVGEIFRNSYNEIPTALLNNGNDKLNLSSYSSSNPDMTVSNVFPFEMESNQPSNLNINIIPSGESNNFSSYLYFNHDGGSVRDSLLIEGTIVNRNILAVKSKNVTKGAINKIPVSLLNSNEIKGMQFDVTLPKEQKNFTWTLKAASNDNFQFDEIANSNDPDISHYIGDVINFDNESGGTHPLYIVSALGADGGFDTTKQQAGVTNQGATSGTISWDLSDVAPGTYYYICGSHGLQMQGKIFIYPKFAIDANSSNLNSERSSNFNLTQSQLSPRKYRFLLYSDSATLFTGNRGEIFNIPVEIKNISNSAMAVADGVHKLTLSNIKISDKDNALANKVTTASGDMLLGGVNNFDPVIDPSQSTFLKENTPVDTYFYKVKASDQDEISFLEEYKIVSGNDDGTFGVIADSGELYVIKSQNLDYETITSFSLGVTVSDGTKTSAEETVTVQLVDDPNPFVVNNFTVQVYSDSGKSGQYGEDSDDIIISSAASSSDYIYSIESGNDKDLFSLDSSTGKLTLNTAPDFSNATDSDKNNIYEVSIKSALADEKTTSKPIDNSERTVSIKEKTTEALTVATITVTEASDVDGDGIIDSLDNCPTTANPLQRDFDSNGEGDLCEDSDGDGVLDWKDNCPIIPNADQKDDNNNDVGDVCEDADGDGVFDQFDNCPNTANADQADMDGDDIGDVCDDSDGDTIFDFPDNCPKTANTDQADFDEDGIGDVCDPDIDGDGVLNEDDDCDDTPSGSKVDVKGCVVFDLPTDNNKVSVTSATCIGTSDGSIGLSVEDASYDYTITVTNNDNVTITGDSKTGSVTGLAAGTYTVCFKVDSQASYEQCFDVVIGEPAALSAYLDIDNDNRTTSIQLGGSSSYNIDINGTKYDVSGDSFIATLPTGLSVIKISTDLDCQGVIEREVFLSEDILYYPNPTQDDVNVHVDGQDTKVTVSVFSEKGSLLYREEQEIKDMSRLTQIDLSKQITGTYIVVMEGTTVRKTFKIVKR